MLKTQSQGQPTKWGNNDVFEEEHATLARAIAPSKDFAKAKQQIYQGDQFLLEQVCFDDPICKSNKRREIG